MKRLQSYGYPLELKYLAKTVKKLKQQIEIDIGVTISKYQKTQKRYLIKKCLIFIFYFRTSYKGK